MKTHYLNLLCLVLGIYCWQPIVSASVVPEDATGIVAEQSAIFNGGGNPLFSASGDENGTTYQAQIGSTNYETFQEALQAAAVGSKTITLLADVDLQGATIESSLPSGKLIIFQFGSYSITNGTLCFNPHTYVRSDKQLNTGAAGELRIAPINPNYRILDYPTGTTTIYQYIVQYDYYAEIGGTKYEHFYDALAAVQDGETVKLLNDVIDIPTVVDCLLTSGTITIDLNGHKGNYTILKIHKGVTVKDLPGQSGFSSSTNGKPSAYRFYLYTDDEECEIKSSGTNATGHTYWVQEKVYPFIADGTKYETYAKAYNGVSDGGTIKLLMDQSGFSFNIKDKDIVFDLNGFNVVSNGLQIKNGKKLKFIDSTATEPVVNDDYTVNYSGGQATIKGYALVGEADGDDDCSLEIESGMVNLKTSINLGYRGYVANHPKFVMNGGLLECDSGYFSICLWGHKSVFEMNGGVLLGNISGNGTIEGTEDFSDTDVIISGGTIIADDCCIYNPQDGRINISGGKIIATEGVGILMRAGQLEMSGGEITALGTSGTLDIGDAEHEPNTPSGVLVFDRDANYPGLSKNDPSIHVTGGTWQSKNFNVFTLHDTNDNFNGTILFEDGVYSDNQISENYLLAGHWMIPNDGYPMFDGHDTYTPGVLVYDDADDFTRKNTIDEIPVGKTITYKRVFSNTQAEKYQPWFTPFNHELTTDDVAAADFYSLNTITHLADGTETKKVFINITSLSEGDVLAARTPYLLKPKSASALQFVSTSDAHLTLYGRGDATTTPTGLSLSAEGTDYPFYGTYTVKQATKALEWLAMSGGEICWNETSAAQLGSYRWYIEPSGLSLAPSQISFVISEGNTTGISSLSDTLSQPGQEDVFTLDGRKIKNSSLPKGVYIQNGKKFVVR